MAVLARLAARVSSLSSAARSAAANSLPPFEKGLVSPCCWRGAVAGAAAVAAAAVGVALAAGHVRVALAGFLGPRLRVGIEVVAVADVDERLAAIVDLLELLQDVVGGGERDVRAIAHFGRTLRPVGRGDDLVGLQAGARDLADRLVEPLAIVGHVDGDRRGAARHDAEHVAFVDQLPGDLLEQLTDAPGVPEIHVQVVDEDQEDAPRRVVGRARRRQQDPFLHRRRVRGHVVDHAAAVREHEGDQLLLDAVLEDLEVLLAQVGDELPLGVADDHRVGDQVDAAADDVARHLRRDQDPFGLLVRGVLHGFVLRAKNGGGASE